MKTLRNILLLACLSGAMGASDQGTLEDYNRAYALSAKYNHGYVPNANPTPRWIGDTHKFWYVLDNDGTKEYTVTDADSRSTKPLFDHKALAKALADNSGKEVKAEDLQLDYLRVSSACDTLWFNKDGRRWIYVNRKKSKLIDNGAIPVPEPRPHWMVVDEEKDAAPVASPDGSKLAFVRENNVGSRRDKRQGKAAQQGRYYRQLLFVVHRVVARRKQGGIVPYSSR